jgi:putative iron-dependent peroxidase
MLGPMSPSQPGILAAVPSFARFAVFVQVPGTDPRPALARLARADLGSLRVVGLGAPLVLGLGAMVPGLRSFPALTTAGFHLPSTQGALWTVLGGSDPGELLLELGAFSDLLGDAFRLDEEVAAFQFRGGRDLSGYEDGTENPKGDLAAETAIVSGGAPGLVGSSFVAVQRYVHDLERFRSFSQTERDHVVGRHHGTNEELADAPASAHVKRAAQESYDPPAFMVRRSMPWGDSREHGLYFVAYGKSLDPFERVLRRMAGLEDGITDGLFKFTRAVSGGYYWCPPVRGGKLDLGALAAV